jgi:hypothetical protein
LSDLIDKLVAPELITIVLKYNNNNNNNDIKYESGEVKIGPKCKNFKKSKNVF